jgi:hypothetical protein
MSLQHGTALSSLPGDARKLADFLSDYLDSTRPRSALVDLAELFNESGSSEAPTAKSVFEEFYRVLLNWMGAGDVDRVRNFYEELATSVQQHSKWPILSAQLSKHARATANALFLEEFIRIFLETNNLARSTTALSGLRRAAWRETLFFMSAVGRPIRVRDVVDQRLFRLDTTASNALSRLVELGLVRKSEKAGSAAYEITWAGRRFVRTYQEAAVGESSSSGSVVKKPASALPETPNFSKAHLKDVDLDAGRLVAATSAWENRSW